MPSVFETEGRSLITQHGSLLSRLATFSQQIYQLTIALFHERFELTPGQRFVHAVDKMVFNFRCQIRCAQVVEPGLNARAEVFELVVDAAGSTSQVDGQVRAHDRPSDA